jgi:hypothetical protein
MMPCLKIVRREPQVAAAFGDGKLGRKLARDIIQAGNDVPGAKLEITDGDLKKAKRGQSQPARRSPESFRGLEFGPD